MIFCEKKLTVPLHVFKLKSDPIVRLKTCSEEYFNVADNIDQCFHKSQSAVNEEKKWKMILRLSVTILLVFYNIQRHQIC